ncbi:MAG: RNA polymerase sigma factor [Candidatus Omnitrophica bacterium]|nr:RNA polymerase sigma factor [Candidatus Omnitrophota bacterium]
MEIQDTNDEELILRFYKENQEALKVIFKRHKDGLFNFALRFVGNRADAEDAVSHAFMMVCEKRYTNKPGASFKTWIYTVARNICLSKIRNRNSFFPLWFKNNNTEDEEPIDVIDQTGIARDQLDQKVISAILQKAIGKLPEEQKEALILREYNGLTYEEIGQVLNCSLDKVKVLIFRARSHLKDVLPPILLEEGR